MKTALWRRAQSTPHVPAGSGRVGCEDRVAWLLRANRVYGTDKGFATGSNFAKAFRGNGFRRSIDGAQLTRWERAAQRAGHAVLRRYEELLNLPPYRLVSIADSVYRSTEGRPGRSYLDREIDADSPDVRRHTEQLIDKARGDDRMNGADWDVLTCNLCAMPSVFLYPSTLWNDLVDRLLAEMIISDGLGWLQRSEALHRLLGHPVGAPVVIAACAALVADPGNQVFVDPLTQLESSPHPDAAGKIIGQILNPTNDHALRGAWCSVAEKVGRGHFAPDELKVLCHHAVELLDTDRQHPACRLAAAELLRQTDYATSQPLASAVRKITRADRHSREVLLSGRVVSGEVAKAITARVGMLAVSMLPRDVLGEDPMLIRLLDEMLFHPQVSKRSNATFLVGATPYRVPVVRALTLELTNRAVLEDAAIAPAMVSTVALLGDDATRKFLERLVLATGVPSFIPEAALWVLGHAAGQCDDTFWARAIRRYRGHLGNMRGIVYALGLTRNMPMLQACRGDPSLPAGARRAAAWWLNMPARILDSTVKAGP
jgi:hypothetical protein